MFDVGYLDVANGTQRNVKRFLPPSPQSSGAAGDFARNDKECSMDAGSNAEHVQRLKFDV
jgi:hypothetical protein